jgi:hypothetical protein
MLPPVDSLACGATAAGTVRVTDVSSGLSVADPVTLRGACPIPTTTTLSLPSFVDTGWPGSVNPARVSAGSTPVTSGTITITAPSFSCTYNAGASSGCTLANLPAGIDQVQAFYSGNTSYAPSSATATVTVSSTVASIPATSPSWAGYVDTSDTYTSVSGSWTVPKVNCGSLFTGGDVASAAVTTVGVGLANPVGIGTSSGCSWYTEQYSAGWWMFPGDWNSLSETVSPGDVMSANVKSTGTPGCWILTISDETKGWGPVSTTPQCNPNAVGESAEWTTQEPQISIAGIGIPNKLSNYGSVTFTQAQATGSNGTATPIWDHPNVALSQFSNGTLKQSFSQLSSDGTQFTTSFVSG